MIVLYTPLLNYIGYVIIIGGIWHTKILNWKTMSNEIHIKTNTFNKKTVMSFSENFDNINFSRIQTNINFH